MNLKINYLLKLSLIYVSSQFSLSSMDNSFQDKSLQEKNHSLSPMVPFNQHLELAFPNLDPDVFLNNGPITNDYYDDYYHYDNNIFASNKDDNPSVGNSIEFLEPIADQFKMNSFSSPLHEEDSFKNSQEDYIEYMRNTLVDIVKKTIETGYISNNEVILLENSLRSLNITIEETPIWPQVSLILKNTTDGEILDSFFFKIVHLFKKPIHYLTDPLIIKNTNFNLNNYKNAFSRSYPDQNIHDFFVNATFHKDISNSLSLMKGGWILPKHEEELWRLFFRSCFLNPKIQKDLNALLEIFKSLESPHTRAHFLRPFYTSFLKRNQSFLQHLSFFLSKTKEPIFLHNGKNFFTDIFDIFSEIMDQASDNSYEKVISSVFSNPNILPKGDEFINLSNHFFCNFTEKFSKGSFYQQRIADFLIKNISKHESKKTKNTLSLFNYIQEKINIILDRKHDDLHLTHWVKNLNYLKNILGNQVPFDDYKSIIEKFSNNIDDFSQLYYFFVSDKNHGHYVNPFDPKLRIYCASKKNISHDDLFDFRVSLFLKILTPPYTSIVKNKEIFNLLLDTFSSQINASQASLLLNKFPPPLTNVTIDCIQSLLKKLSFRKITPDIPPHIKQTLEKLQPCCHQAKNTHINHFKKDQEHDFYKNHLSEIEKSNISIIEPIGCLEHIIQWLYFNPNRILSIEQKKKGLLLYYQAERRLKGRTFENVTFEKNELLFHTNLLSPQLPPTVTFNGLTPSSYIPSLKKHITLSISIIENCSLMTDRMNKDECYEFYLDNFLIKTASLFSGLRTPTTNSDILKRFLAIDYGIISQNEEQIQAYDTFFNRQSMEALCELITYSKTLPLLLSEFSPVQNPYFDAPSTETIKTTNRDSIGESEITQLITTEKDYNNIIQEAFTSFQKTKAFKEGQHTFNDIKDLYTKTIISTLEESGLTLKKKEDLWIDILYKLYHKKKEPRKAQIIPSSKMHPVLRSRSRSKSNNSSHKFQNDQDIFRKNAPKKWNDQTIEKEYTTNHDLHNKPHRKNVQDILSKIKEDMKTKCREIFPLVWESCQRYATHIMENISEKRE